MLCVIMPDAILLGVIMLSVINGKRHYSKCHGECRYTESC